MALRQCHDGLYPSDRDGNFTATRTNDALPPNSFCQTRFLEVTIIDDHQDLHNNRGVSWSSEEYTKVKSVIGFRNSAVVPEGKQYPVCRLRNNEQQATQHNVFTMSCCALPAAFNMAAFSAQSS